jgi:hypothetical protein
VQLKGWREALRLLAAIHLALFVAHVFFGPETLFLESEGTDEKQRPPPARKWWHQYVVFRIYDRTPLQMIEFIRPFLMGTHLVVLLPSVAYSLVFAYTNIFVVRVSFSV